MNKLIFNTRKVFAFALLTLLFGSKSLLSYAEGGDKKEKGSTGSVNASSADVKYITGKDGEYLFNVVYNNTTGSRFTVIVLDAEGYQLFQSQYSDKKFDKKFKLADPEEFGKLTFIIRNQSDNSVQRFEVNANNKVVEEVEVKEVK